MQEPFGLEVWANTSTHLTYTVTQHFISYKGGDKDQTLDHSLTEVLITCYKSILSKAPIDIYECSQCTYMSSNALVVYSC